jgi:hypothetical protein
MPTLIALALKLGVPARFAKAAIIAALFILALGLLGLGKCAYDKSIINTHEAKQEAATAKADRKADTKAAEQRRADDARLTTETQQIKEAVNEAGNDPTARRAAYYDCVRKQQAARHSGKPPADC